MATKLNVGQICSVKICINSYNPRYTYKKSKKILFFWNKKEGYYFTPFLDDVYVSVENIESSDKTLICRDNKVYYKPHLEIKMSNGNMYEMFFETEKELHDFMETDEMKGVNYWINL